MGGMDMSTMNMKEPKASPLPSPHSGSGTGWEPASLPSHEWMLMRGGWELMAHGVIFIDYNQQGGPRGAGKAESVNWGMLMEQHKLGAGTILFRQMFSAESLTSPHPGFPDLFQTGETYHGQALVDHQHPHNVFAELSLLYTLPLTKKAFVGILRRPLGRAGAGTGGLYPSSFGSRTSSGTSQPPLAGLNPYQLRGNYHWLCNRPRAARSLRLQWPRAE
jgi:hypothetical protein